MPKWNAPDKSFFVATRVFVFQAMILFWSYEETKHDD